MICMNKKAKEHKDRTCKKCKVELENPQKRRIHEQECEISEQNLL